MKIKYGNLDREVIGVVKDYVAQSVRSGQTAYLRLKGDSVSLGMYTIRYEPGKNGLTIIAIVLMNISQLMHLNLNHLKT